MADNPTWERQPSDTEKSWEAFQVYRDMGRSRSLRNVAQKLAKSEQLIKRWSSEHGWVERCESYDADQDEQRKERLEQRRLEVEERSLNWYARVAAGIEKKLTDYERTEWAGVAPTLIADMVAVMQKATDEGRRAVGLPHRITENKTEVTGKDGGPIALTWEDMFRRDT